MEGTAEQRAGGAADPEGRGSESAESIAEETEPSESSDEEYGWGEEYSDSEDGGEEGEDSEAEAGTSVGAGGFDADDEVLMSFTGHRNCRTVKGVSFLGESQEYVMSGSDDGHIYIWTTVDGVLRQWLPGDAHVVNCLEPNPAHPLCFATSGIEDDIKLWAPTAAQFRPVSAAAHRVIERNRMSQGPHRRPSTSARRILLRLQQMAEARGDGEEPPVLGVMPVPGGCGVQ